KGNAYLQKTDIFKRLMWFSFQGDDSWIPLPIDRVKEIQQQNLQGIKPDAIKDLSIEIEPKEKERNYDYENVVGQYSLTRLDDTKTKKRPSKSRSKNKKRVEAPGNKTADIKAERKPVEKKPFQKNAPERKAAAKKPVTKRTPENEVTKPSQTTEEGQPRKKKRF